MELIHKNLVFQNKDFKDSQTALSYLSQQVEQAGYAKDTYHTAVIEREKKFPTGLPTGDICVAIPHADSIHVNKSTLAVMTLKKSIDFHNMGDPDNTLPVSIIIMMAIAEPRGQLTMLQKIMGIVQDQKHLKTLTTYDTQFDLYSDLKNTFNEINI